MNILSNDRPFFTSFQLKILACVFMAIDHIGYSLFPNVALLRIIGRLALPIFAFFIAEGCRYTRHKLKRFLTLLICGAVFLLAYYVAFRYIYGSIFITFAASTLVIYILSECKKNIFPKIKTLPLIISLLLLILSICGYYYLNTLIKIDYGFYGMLIPVFISIFDFHKIDAPEKLKTADNLYVKLLCMSIPMVLLSLNNALHYLQFFSFFAIPLLLLYNGKPGKRKMKYFFYIFYPVHLLIIQGISMLISALD